MHSASTPPVALPSRSPARRGAALVYALIAVLVVALLSLSIGRLVAYHFQSEEQARGYSQSIYIAEAAANWQLNRMSRSSPRGVFIPRRIPYSELSLTRQPLAPLYLNGLNQPPVGNASVWTEATTSGVLWVPPADFTINAFGQDPNTGITRGVQFTGAATGLATRYSLFGANRLTFQAGSNRDDVATVQRGYIGTNGLLTYAGSVPPENTPRESRGGFGGCRLGGEGASLQPAPNRWRSGWDFPRLPDPVFWPTNNDYVETVWAGDSVANLETNNDNVQIFKKMNDDAHPEGVFKPFLNRNGRPLTKLTPADFNASDYTPGGSGPVQHTILLRARDVSVARRHNLFYFTNLYMRDSDVLILDLRANVSKQGGVRPTAIRIVINNNDSKPLSDMAANEIRVTNLAYYQNIGDSGSLRNAPPTPAYIWVNNTNTPFVYEPQANFNSNKDIDASRIVGVEDEPNEQYNYSTGPYLYGMVFGNPSFASDTNRAGDIEIHGVDANGNNSSPQVGVLVGNHVTLNGPVTAIGIGAFKPGDVEDPRDPNRYVMYYRVTSYVETNQNGRQISRNAAYGYGAFQP